MKRGTCDWCGDRKELLKEGHAEVCWDCKYKTKRMKIGKVIPARPEDFESNNLTLKEYGGYMRRTKQKPILGMLDK